MNYVPIEVVYETTLKCNMACKHCGSNAGQSRHNELTLDESIKLVRDLHELETRYVVLSGGEPFLNPNWYEIGTEVKNCGMKLGFVSNGYMINNEIIKKLSSLDIEIIGISIDGGKEIHDIIRCKGSFDNAVNNIKRLQKVGITTGIITSLSKLNINSLDDVLFTCIANNINAWQIQTTVPMGRMERELTLSNQEYKKACNWISRTRKNYSDLICINGADSMGLGCKELVSDIPYTECNAGIKVLGIRANGDVTGCLSIMNDAYIEGNIRTKPLKEIWNDPNAFKYNRQHKGVTGNCKQCDTPQNCKGGCTSINIAVNHEEHNSPYCIRF